MQTKVLKNLLKIFDEHLKSGANEIAIRDEKELFLDFGGKWNLVHDDRLTLSILESFCVELANSREARFDVKTPTLSTSIPGTKYRVQAMHQSILSSQRIQINIRIPGKIYSLDNFGLSDHLNYTREDLVSWVKKRKNILISGGTGSGKTSLLNSLLQVVRKEERVVTIEDSPEINIENPNKTQILVSKKDDDYFTYIDGINASMRLSPTRLILGELDTRNTLPFLRLNNTGHSGSISTVHANSAHDALNAIAINAMFHHHISKEVLEDYITAGLDYIIQIMFDRASNERIIVEVIDVKNTQFKKKIA